MQARRANHHKKYVEVRADHMLDGRVIPRWFRPEEENKVVIDRILDIRQAASLKAGGSGIRYICQVEGREVRLFHDDDKWYLEV